jgi:hypothetical protein
MPTKIFLKTFREEALDLDEEEAEEEADKVSEWDDKIVSETAFN